jgi:hypothetical protein
VIEVGDACYRASAPRAPRNHAARGDRCARGPADADPAARPAIAIGAVATERAANRFGFRLSDRAAATSAGTPSANAIATTGITARTSRALPARGIRNPPWAAAPWRGGVPDAPPIRYGAAPTVTVVRRAVQPRSRS